MLFEEFKEFKEFWSSRRGSQEPEARIQEVSSSPIA
jgi:hypothetical protein